MVKLKNNLKNETSPYLLQHADNPVNWYPWCDKAFKKAKREDKPIFLSIGYSTCHWCHVMAHESFEDEKIAKILNKNFISIKVDKEERPDIDSIYMAVCQALTGSGGWPTSIFMTPDQKPFFAGTYFSKDSKYGIIGFKDLIVTISERWKTNRQDLLQSSQKIIKHLNTKENTKGNIDNKIIDTAVSAYKQSFDEVYGGFGNEPKFPVPHNLLFLMQYYEINDDINALKIVEKTLLQMYKGGIFDHIGYGFSRYSTDKYFLVPHFEKMLCDNALLLITYSKAYYVTKNEIYKNIAEKTAEYILREMTSQDGAFYCAQDADSNGIEGKYYLFDYDEITTLLNKDVGEKFNSYYGITAQGNFEGKNIPNLLNNISIDNRFKEYLPKVYEYRKSRTELHLDDKILTSWNSLMIAAFAIMYRIFDEDKYLTVAKRACKFIEDNLFKNDTLYVSYRNGVRSGKGFIDDYAFYAYALINLYEATLDNSYLQKAIKICNKAISDFYDTKNGGFYLYGKESEELIIKPKETYDGAIPSGNSVMAYNLVKLSNITNDSNFEKKAKQQLEFMSANAKKYPTGHSFYLIALSMYLNDSETIICVLKNSSDLEKVKDKIKLYANIKILENPTDEYKLVNDKTTFYICKNHSCLPPTNDFYKLVK